MFLSPPSAPSGGASGGTGGGGESPAAVGSPETEANPDRVKNLRGRVATKPNLAPTPQGKARVQFVLAEHQEHEGEEQTIFHRVYTLNKQAESLGRRGLAVGQQVGVDGYRQQRTTRKKDGSAVEHEVIYANVVRTFGKRERVVRATPHTTTATPTVGMAVCDHLPAICFLRDCPHVLRCSGTRPLLSYRRYSPRLLRHFSNASVCVGASTSYTRVNLYFGICLTSFLSHSRRDPLAQTGTRSSGSAAALDRRSAWLWHTGNA